MGKYLLDRGNICLIIDQSNCKLYRLNNHLLIRKSIYVDCIRPAYIFNTIDVWCVIYVQYY